MKHKKPYKTYTREFKQEAVRLMETTDRPAAEVAMELGIRRNQLYKWKQLAEPGGNLRPGTEPPRHALGKMAILVNVSQITHYSRAGGNICGRTNQIGRPKQPPGS